MSTEGRSSPPPAEVIHPPELMARERARHAKAQEIAEVFKESVATIGGIERALAAAGVQPDFHVASLYADARRWRDLLLGAEGIEYDAFEDALSVLDSKS